jgi:hypothetical protein
VCPNHWLSFRKIGQNYLTHFTIRYRATKSTMPGSSSLLCVDAGNAVLATLDQPLSKSFADETGLVELPH